ncbi:MAG: hypothetical protein ACJ8LD_21070 [Pantoea agglomerans]
MIDYSGKIITPGFVDTHVHYPQITMISEYGEQLIGWLNTYTFPTEIKYSNHAYASQEASVFLDQLVKMAQPRHWCLQPVRQSQLMHFLSRR